MDWYESIVSNLASAPICGYGVAQPATSEPTALACLALHAAGEIRPAIQAANCLADFQKRDGSVGVTQDASSPGWTTSLAVLAWTAAEDTKPEYGPRIRRALDWIKSVRGDTGPRCPEVGHNTTLAGWPWVKGTHSWIEPTALHLLALKATGHANHERARLAVRVLLDRQLSQGGCNYGNTMVMGNLLRPHVQPTGISLLGLVGERDGRERIDRTLRYLEQKIGPDTTTSSLAWALIGLAAHGRYPERAEEWLETAYRRTERRGRSPYKLALLALAALGDKSPLVTLPAAGRFVATRG